ncbi:1216_t:CDS:2, partial [Cetraspora pellucida]
QSNNTNDSEYDSNFENSEDEIEINSYLIEAKKWLLATLPLGDLDALKDEVANFDSESKSSSESSGLSDYEENSTIMQFQHNTRSQKNQLNVLEINLDLIIKKIQTDIYNSLFDEVHNDTIHKCRYQLRLTDVQQISKTPEELEFYDDVLDESNASNTSLNSSRPFSKKWLKILYLVSRKGLKLQWMN